MKKKLAQILAVVLAVSCFSGCTLILEGESDNGSESGYLESVESGDSGSSGNEITVDIESEKVNSEAEWNAAFDFDLSENYVVMSDMPLYADLNDIENTMGYTIVEMDKQVKKYKHNEYIENKEVKGSWEEYYTEIDGKVYGYIKSDYNDLVNNEHIIVDDGWELETYKNFEAAIRHKDMLVGFLCADCQNRYYLANEAFRMTECEHFSYKNYTYDEEEKVYMADLTTFIGNEAGEGNSLITKICVKEGKVYAILFELVMSIEASTLKANMLFLIGEATEIEFPPFETEEEDSSQESAYIRNVKTKTS